MTMTRSEINQMVTDYKTALEHKVAGEILVQDRTARAALLESRILLLRSPKDKNADIRKHEARTTLAADEAYQAALSNLADAHAAASVASVEFKAQELLTSLTRAWLYAQRPELP